MSMSQTPYIGKRVGKKVIKEATERLFHSNEQLLCAIRGGVEVPLMTKVTVATRKGYLFVTNERIIFYMPKLLGRFEFEVYPFDKITSVNYSRGLTSDRIEITVASDKKVLKWIPKGDGKIPSEIIHNIITGPQRATMVSFPGANTMTTTNDTMFCPNCGARIPRNARFCPSCGFKLS